MERYQDPSDPANSSEHHTGKPCVMKGCSNPAGTAWSPLLCFSHNVERIDRINAAFAAEIEWREKINQKKETTT